MLAAASGREDEAWRVGNCFARQGGQARQTGGRAAQPLVHRRPGGGFAGAAVEPGRQGLGRGGVFASLQAGASPPGVVG
ncbi:hypothetical protein BU198_25070 [Streptomyces sp. CBMA156]|nr:hypothetical protein [Streptomyces sp. CBMA156]